eukprot:CAMPEP_0206333286 /NCGR_PEP_ID=MMETSP0106_2-20121207/25200_1 /ASSEMBLY_ACC=CAM_ASM_000206 /TAXON_ID=81532 /ORGANISM="Acanthoeca-like sp., Strain 10tr" /LENGTH=59 /DNA_ID=CAMNT_0053766159 /DNA_START=446 /DNA_END=625 /DNA_ORIENTATION=-
MTKSFDLSRIAAEPANCGFRRLHAPHHDLWITSIIGLPAGFANSTASSNLTQLIPSPQP